MSAWYRFLIIVSWLSWPIILGAQNVVPESPLMFQLSEDNADTLGSDTIWTFYNDSLGELELADLDFQQFLPAKEFKGLDSKWLEQGRTWWWASIENGLQDTSKWSLNMTFATWNEIYIQQNQEVVSYKFGMINPLDEKNTSVSGCATTLNFPPLSRTHLLLKTGGNSYVVDAIPVIHSIEKEQNWANKILSKYLGLFYFRMAFWGICFFLFLFSLGQFFINKRKEYLLYALYVLSVFLFHLSINEFYNRYPILLSYFPVLYSYSMFFSYPLIIFYLWFAIEFLDLSTKSPMLERWIFYFIYFLIATAIVLLILKWTVSTQMITKLVFVITRLLTFGISLFLITVIIIKLRGWQTAFFIIGSIIMTLGTLLTTIYGLTSLPQTGNIFIDDSVFANMTGFLIEFLFFSLGLGYKTRMIDLENEEISSQLIHGLKEREVLQSQLNEKLQVEIQFEKQKLERKENENKILQLESELLQSQMNPHFIFNSLNSIKHHSLTKEPRETAKYITSFARLMRTILQNSKQTLVPLSQELNAMKLYVEIEQKRFSKKFDFELELLDNINPEVFLIPPLLIQPYIENSIWHGLMQKTGDKLLNLKLEECEGGFRVIVEDNGIGRQASEKIQKAKDAFKKISLGTVITSSRLDLIERRYGKRASVQTEDLFNSENEVSGTRVTIFIPTLSMKLND